MASRQFPKYPAAEGFSLVELLIALAINMVIVIAASYLYLGTRESQRVTTERADLYQTGKFALDIIGRDLENAGYYPAFRVENKTQALVVGGYFNPVAGSPAAYSAGIFGCDAKRFNPTTSVCASNPAGITADTLVINYFNSDAFGLDIGQRADCQRRDVANSSTNAARVGANTATSGLPPSLPLFVSNRYSLEAATLQIEGNTINTAGLACNGNGVNPESETYQPLMVGIEQMRFRYGIFSSETSQHPDQFLSAADVDSEEAVTILGNPRSGWQRVSSVRVCLLVRSMEMIRSEGLASYTLADCDGTDRVFSDGVERRIVSQVFAVKNNLPSTYPMP